MSADGARTVVDGGAGAGAARRRVVVGITGASGTEYGVRILRALREAGVETHLVVSASGQLTRSLETDYSQEDVEVLADRVWKPTDMAAAIASGSFLTDGMVIAPCSMRTLGRSPPARRAPSSAERPTSMSRSGGGSCWSRGRRRCRSSTCAT